MLEGIYGIQGIQDTQSIVNMQVLRQLGQAQASQKVKDEFMAIFYKELLKQAFKPPNVGFSGEGENSSNSIAAVFSSDLLVEKMALELAQSRAFSVDDIFPGVIEEKEKLDD